MDEVSDANNCHVSPPIVVAISRAPSLMRETVSAMPIASIPDDAVLVRARNVVFSDLDNELIIISSEAGKVFSLNAVARHAWVTMAEPITFGALCEALRAAFEVEPRQCVDDTAELVRDLRDLGLLSVVQTAP